MNIENLINSYIETALWSSTFEAQGNDCIPFDEYYSIEDCSHELIEQSKKDIADFIKQAGDLLDDEDIHQVMHDFWLTRNGHGAGFWDGDYGQQKGDELTKIAQNFGSISLYISALDGKEKVYSQ